MRHGLRTGKYTIIIVINIVDFHEEVKIGLKKTRIPEHSCLLIGTDERTSHYVYTSSETVCTYVVCYVEENGENAFSGKARS